MGDFLSAAYRVLKQKGLPLTVREITEIAMREKILATGGKTPHQTMKSKLSTDILNKHERSLFKRTDTGRFGLREWGEGEYRAERFKKSLLDEDIIVFNRSYLNEIVKSNGISPVNITRLEQFLKTICFAEKRSIAEEDDQLVQLISAFIVRHNDKYLTYKRTRRLPESKLHGYYSIMFGGHITVSEFLPLLRILDPKMKSPFVTRELFEELVVKPSAISALEFRGVLYDDSVAVSRLHLGIVYDVSIGTGDYSIGERGFLMDPRIEDLGSIVRRIDDFENWSRIIIEEEQGDENRWVACRKGAI
jgi:predicted NUDIX family phosphoesterase